MNLVESLLKADAKKAEELQTEEIVSKKLARILETDELIKIKIQEIPAKRMNEILGIQFDKKGRFDSERAFTAKAVTCIEGIIDPPVKDERLCKYYNCATPKDLVIKLFGNEISNISDRIAIISGFGSEDEEEEEEIKN